MPIPFGRADAQDQQQRPDSERPTVPVRRTGMSAALTKCMYLKAYCPRLLSAPCASETIQMLSVLAHSHPRIRPLAKVPSGATNTSCCGDTPSMCWMPDR